SFMAVMLVVMAVVVTLMAMIVAVGVGFKIMVMIVFAVIMMVVLMRAAIGIGVELLGGHWLLGHLGELDDKVDDLLLEDRCPDLGEHFRVVAVEIVDLPLLPGELPDALEQRPVHLVVGDFDLVARADFGQQ